MKKLSNYLELPKNCFKKFVSANFSIHSCEFPSTHHIIRLVGQKSYVLCHALKVMNVISRGRRNATMAADGVLGILRCKALPTGYCEEHFLLGSATHRCGYNSTLNWVSPMAMTSPTLITAVSPNFTPFNNVPLRLPTSSSSH